MHTKMNNRRIIAFVTAKLMAVLALVAAFQKVLSSSLLEEWSGYDFIQPSGMNVASIDWLIILIFLFVLLIIRHGIPLR